MRILLVEDHQRLAESIRCALQASGFTVDTLTDGIQADLALKSSDYALALIDIGLPRLDGLALLARLRSRGQRLPILLLSARGEISDRVHGLNLGADDYLTKPFALDELQARIRALLRRALAAGDKQQCCGDLCYDLASARFSLKSKPLNLTAREQAVLESLIGRPGRVLSKEQLAAKVFSLNQEASPAAIEIYIHRLRKKLIGSDVQIVTFRGLGYLLEAIPR